MSFSKITMNLEGSGIRRDVLDGVEHLVVPSVGIMEGVWPGSDGPLFYPRSELAPTPLLWNHKPIVVYHPEIDGVGVSACNAEILNKQKVGVILNARYEEDSTKLKWESWLSVPALKRVDNRILEALEKGEKVEGSTGLFQETEVVKGVFNNTDYKGIARNHKPDHYALLPDQTGACSVADGAGLLQNKKTSFELAEEKRKAATPLTMNELSASNIQQALQQIIVEKFYNKATDSCYPWVCDVYSTFFVYEFEGKLYRLDYSKSDTSVEVSGSPEEVVRVTEYRTVAGTFVGNASATQLPQKETNMPKPEKVSALIENKASRWEESDRAFLMTLNEEVLDKMIPVDAPAPAAPVEPTPTPTPATPAPVANSAVPVPQPMTGEQFLATLAPGPYRDLIVNSVTQFTANRKAMTDQILALPHNKMPEVTLNSMPWDDFKNFHAMVCPAQPQSPFPPALFSGAAGFIPTGNTALTQEGLSLPTMNFADPLAKGKKEGSAV